MSNYDTFILFAAEYTDLADAEADYELVKDMYYELGLVDTFDAAVISKDTEGKVKIVKKHEQPTRKGGWVGAGLGLAAGASLLLPLVQVSLSELQVAVPHSVLLPATCHEACLAMT